MSSIQKIKKRNGEIVDFDIRKITTAVKKAFFAVTGNDHEKQASQITEEVKKTLEERSTEKNSPVSVDDVERTTPPSVEDVQDLVEKSIMNMGFYDVAKSYIIYRYEHAKQREEKKLETLEKIDEGALMVLKRSGEREPFSLQKLERSIAEATRGFENVVDAHAIALQCRAEIYDGIKTKDISRAVIMATRPLIEKDPAYSYVAARMLLSEIYKQVIGRDIVDFSRLEEQLREAFVQNFKAAVKLGRLDPRLLEYDLEFLASKVDLSRDRLLRYMGTQTLHDRYIIWKDADSRDAMETPQFLWMRVAMGLALNEKDKNQRAVEFYDVISTLRFVPSTPTLFHAGTPHPQLSSCYLNTVKDSLSHIFKVYGDNAQLSKWSGGIGTDWTSIRGTGARIKGTGVESQGVIPFLKIANDATVAINRSGRRRGAACVYLETWHYDIESFLELRKNTGDDRRRTHDMNTSNWIPDLFMKRVRENGDWTLFSSDDVPDLHETYGKKFEQAYTGYEKKAKEGKIRLFKTIKARDLWKKMINMLFETGHPWITFKDPSNIRSPQDHVGVVHNSNLCTEITLNTSQEETAVCNLGSVNLTRHVINGRFDEALVGDTVTTAMRMLDNVIDINFYPTKEAEISNKRHRPVGLGVMGLQDALYLLNINFDSDAGVDFSDYTQEVVSYYAIQASAHIAGEKGRYPSYSGSKWDRGILPQDTLDLLEKERGEKIDVPRAGRLDWTPVREAVKKYGMRNSNCLAIAPTATIANIAGSFPSIEPIYKNIYVKANQAGDFTVVNPYLVEELKQAGLWDYEMLGKIKYNDGSIQAIQEIPQPIRDKYKEVFEINPQWMMKAAAHRGKWIDQSQSLNIFYKGTSGRDLSDYYQYAWSLGLKTTYYLRTLAISQVEKSTVSTGEFGSTHVRKAGRPKVMMPSQIPAKPAVPSMASAMPRMSAASPISDGPGAAIAGGLSATPSQIKKMTPAVKNTGTAFKNSAPEIKLCKINDPDCEACQ
jgi:ribonucleoside-diphosphate reductase alpha chain